MDIMTGFGFVGHSFFWLVPVLVVALLVWLLVSLSKDVDNQQHK